MDNTHKDDDKLIAAMEKRLKRIYSRSQSEIGTAWTKFMKETGDEISALQKQYDDLKKSGTADASEIRKAGRDLAAKKQALTIGNRHYQEVTQNVAEELLRINQTAVAYVNGKLPDVYSRNYNYASVQIKDQISISYNFALTDPWTVKNLATKNKSLLPYKVVNGKKDVRWNVKKVNSEVMQGIIQGESMDEIASRLRNVTNMNMASAIRNARTSVTAAENKGRQDSYEAATRQGIVLEKEWISAHDTRVRAWHLDLDGVTVAYDKPFVNDYGEIMFPGDPTADPANVYNCRCTVGAEVLGFRRADGTISFVDDVPEDKRNVVISRLSKTKAKLPEGKNNGTRRINKNRKR